MGLDALDASCLIKNFDLHAIHIGRKEDVFIDSITLHFCGKVCQTELNRAHLQNPVFAIK